MGIVWNVLGKMGFAHRSQINISKKSQAEDAVVNDVGGIGLSANDVSKQALENFYKINGWVFGGVNIIAESIAGLPSTILKDGEVVEREDIQAFIDNPNPDQTKDEYFTDLVIGLLLNGNSFEEWVKDNDGLQSYVLKPYHMKVQRKKADKEYKYEVNGTEVNFDPDEIIQGKMPNPFSDVIGMSPLEPIRVNLETWWRIDRYNERFIANGARLSGIFTSAQSIAKATLDRFRNHINKVLMGEKNAGESAVLSHGMDFKQLSVSPKDMDYLGLIKYERETLLSVLKLPPVTVGVFEFANYANSLIQSKIFWENAIIPLMKKVQANHSKVVAKLFGEGFSYKFSTDEIEALQDNRLARVQADEIELRIATAFINEFRKRDGKEPLKGGDEPRVGIATVRLSEADSEVNLFGDNDLELNTLTEGGKDEKENEENQAA